MSSLDCASGTVCVNQMCVECGDDPDCAPGEACVYETCRTACDSDNDCVGDGMLCENGGCVACTSNTQCASGTECVQGECRISDCEPDSTFCRYGLLPVDVVTCNTSGRGASTLACQAGETCTASSGPAECVPRVDGCNFGGRSCIVDENGHGWKECNDEASEVIDSGYCAATEYCSNGECGPCPSPSIYGNCSRDAIGTVTCTPDMVTVTPCDGGRACFAGMGCMLPQGDCDVGAPVCIGTSVWECVVSDGGAGRVYSHLVTCPERCFDGACAPLSSATPP